jgi:hypothetical protein
MLIPEKDGKKITYNLMESLPEKVELYSGELEGREALLELSLYNLGIKRFISLLPKSSQEILLEVLMEEQEHIWMVFRVQNNHFPNFVPVLTRNSKEKALEAIRGLPGDKKYQLFKIPISGDFKLGELEHYHINED